MKIKYTHALAAVALVVPAMAMATHPTGPFPGGVVNNDNPDGFRNKGQCQSALSHEINRQRQDPDVRPVSAKDEKASEFQKRMLDAYECRFSEDVGAFRVEFR